jgi:hypothetical protein
MDATDDKARLIRESHQLICEYEARRQVEPDPKERLRCQREIAGQWTLIEGYLEEYVTLCQGLRQALPEDIAQIAAHFPRFFAQEFRKTYISLRDTGQAGRNLSDQLAQLLRRLGEYHEYLPIFRYPPLGVVVAARLATTGSRCREISSNVLRDW